MVDFGKHIEWIEVASVTKKFAYRSVGAGFGLSSAGVAPPSFGNIKTRQKCVKFAKNNRKCLTFIKIRPRASDFGPSNECKV